MFKQTYKTKTNEKLLSGKYTMINNKWGQIIYIYISAIYFQVCNKWYTLQNINELLKRNNIIKQLKLTKAHKSYQS